MRCWAGLYDAQEDTLNGSENKFAMCVITITDDESMQYGAELYASGYANPSIGFITCMENLFLTGG